MKISKTDFELIKRGMIFLAAGILVAGIGYGATNWFAKKKEQEMMIAKNNLLQTKSRYAQSRDEGEALRKDLPVYQSLYEHGFIGEEQRLNWIETISQIRSSRMFYDIEYKIDPQQPYALEPPPELFSVFASPMTFQFDLLHEEDLLYFLEDLKNKAKGTFIVNECEITRKEEAGVDSRTTLAKLKSTCTISWISLKEKT